MRLLVSTHTAVRAQARRIRRRAVLNFALRDLKTKVGLEIGGPSPLFARGGWLPVYCLAARVDNCNFSTRTIWEGEITAGDTFCFEPSRRPGRQFISEASDLKTVDTCAYDFIISSHTLEHVADPIRALEEWKRVLKPGGMLVLVLPHYEATFDYRRPVTTLDHLIHDYRTNAPETDTTHLEEILALHDIKRDPGVSSAAEFAARSRDNYRNRCLHHHVFDSRLVAGLLDHVRLQIVVIETGQPHHIFTISRKCAGADLPQNRRFTKSGARFLKRSIFRADRMATPL